MRHKLHQEAATADSPTINKKLGRNNLTYLKKKKIYAKFWSHLYPRRERR